MNLKPAADSTFHMHYSGNLIFELERGNQRNRSFLVRNVMEDLRSHSTRQSQALAPSPHPTAAPQGRAASPRDWRSSGTAPQSNRSGAARRSLRGAAKPHAYPEDAELTIDPVNIRKKLNFKDGLHVKDHRPSKRVKREEIRCYCYCAIWDNRDGFRSAEPIVKRNQRCTIGELGHEGDPVLNITIDKPFSFSAAELFVPIRAGSISKMGMGDKYSLEIKIVPCSSRDRWPIIPVLSKFEGSLISRDAIQAHPRGYLVSSYPNLPNAPAVGVPMSVALDQDGRTYKTKYGLDVKASWSCQRPQLDDIFSSRRLRSPSPRQCPTPKSEPSSVSYLDLLSTSRTEVATSGTSPVADGSAAQVYYRWSFSSKQSNKDLRPGVFDGLRCYCNTRIFPTLDLLRFHLSSSHDKYTFHLEEPKGSNGGGPVRRHTFRITPAPIVRERAANHVRDEREMTWKRPKRPFDIKAYNEGDDSWTGEMGVRMRRGAVLLARTQSLTSPLAIAKGGAAGEREQPEKTLAIPAPARQRFKVPAARTRYRTPFYRSTSCRKLDAGESMSESDEDVDDTWLKEKHLNSLRDNGSLTGAEKDFICRWDEHIMREGFPLPHYIADSVVRFTRANVVWLRKSDILPQFRAHTTSLAARKVIGISVVHHCSELIEGSIQTPPDSIGAMSPRDDLAAEVGCPSRSSPSSWKRDQTDPSIRSAYGICGVCHESTTRQKKLTIYCSKEASPFKLDIEGFDADLFSQACPALGISYHFPCIGLDHRELDWTCSVCNDRGEGRKD